GLKVLLPRLKALFGEMGVRGEILVVDGGSKDDTVAVARAHGARTLRQKGKGFGSAVVEGIEASGAPWVGIMDADGSHDPAEFKKFWALRDTAKLVVGSRYCRGGTADMDLTRQILSRSLNTVCKRVLELPVRESSSGFRLYHRESALAVGSKATDFSIQQDLMVGILANGGKVVELPIHYAPRVGGVSKANAWKLLPAYIRLLLRLKQKRGGWRAEAGLFAALGVALAAGLTGLCGGLPGPGRLRALPEAARTSPEFAPRLADAWRKLYAEIERSHAELRAEEPRTGVVGRVEVPAGWTFPPGALLNSARSLLTQSVNPDEKKSFIILGRMRPWKLDFEPLYAQYGGAFVYPLGAFLGAAHLLHLARLTPDLAHYLSVPSDMARLYLLGRLFVLLFHLGTVFLVYEFGRTLSGRRTAALAALLWALTPLAVVNAHVLKPHPVAAFWFVAAAYCAYRVVEEGRWNDFLLCGLSAGLAAGGNPAVAYAVGLPVLARLVRGEGSWGWALGSSAAGAGLIALTNPYLVLAPSHFAWELTVFSPSHFGFSAAGLAAFFARVVPHGLGIALSSLAAVALVRALFADAPRRLLALLVLGGGVLVLGRFPEFSAMLSSLRLHYAGAALSVVLAVDLLALLPRPAAVLLAAVALAETGARGSVYLENLRRESAGGTRAAAADWIDAHVPAGAEVGLWRYPEPAHTPPFRWDRVKLVVLEKPAEAAGREPEWFVGDTKEVSQLEAALPGKYALAAAFPAAAPFGRGPEDDSFFANASMSVYHRAGASK
ncbi:MAG: glycosyltransferase, partial [Elusimicrobia bacterium]|nr:glycosyltransferase [Elusimicrobiota bacterium]